MRLLSLALAISISVRGATLAYSQTRCCHEAARGYTDYLSLLRINGRWWIVNKIYTMERTSR